MDLPLSWSTPTHFCPSRPSFTLGIKPTSPASETLPWLLGQDTLLQNVGPRDYGWWRTRSVEVRIHSEDVWVLLPFKKQLMS